MGVFKVCKALIDTCGKHELHVLVYLPRTIFDKVKPFILNTFDTVVSVAEIMAQGSFQVLESVDIANEGPHGISNQRIVENACVEDALEKVHLVF